MTPLRLPALAAGIALVAASAFAQAQPQTQAQSQAQGQSQSQPADSPPGRMMGRGPGGGMGMGMRGGADNTFGWSMMTAAERQEHQAKMHGFTTAQACRAYVAEHHRLMVERARQRGMAMPAEPRGNPCAGLK